MVNNLSKQTIEDNYLNSKTIMIKNSISNNRHRINTYSNRNKCKITQEATRKLIEIITI